MDYTVHGILQARILEWAAFPFSRGSSQPRDQTQISCIIGGLFLSAEPPGKPKNTKVGIKLGSPEYSREENKTILSYGTHGLSVLIHCSYEMS